MISQHLPNYSKFNAVKHGKLILAPLMMAPCWSHSSCSDLLRGIVREHKFIVERGLFDYLLALPDQFGTELKSLEHTSLWLDSGAGDGRAIADLYWLNSDNGNVEDYKNHGASIGINHYDPTLAPLWKTLGEIGRQPIEDRPMALGITYQFSNPARQKKSSLS